MVSCGRSFLHRRRLEVIDEPDRQYADRALMFFETERPLGQSCLLNTVGGKPARSL